MIVSIRGTNGSGKSTVVRSLMKRVEAFGTVRPILGRLSKKRPEAYRLQLPDTPAATYVLGPYLTDCGGCDSIQPYDRIIELIKDYSAKGHVVFEGVLVASSYGRIGELLEAFGEEAIFLFLNTSLEECLRRIEERRGRPRDERLVKNVSGKYHSIMRIRQRVKAEGKMQALYMSSMEAPAVLVDLVRRAPWHDQLQTRRRRR